MVGQNPQLVDRHDARVLKLAADLGLLDKAVDEVGPVTMVIQEDLECQSASEVGVPSLEDDAHAATGDLADKPVSPHEAADGAFAGGKRISLRVSVGQQ